MISKQISLIFTILFLTGLMNSTACSARTNPKTRDNLRRLTNTDEPRVILSLAKRLLTDSDPLVRYKAAQALGQKEASAESAIKELISILDQDYVGIAASKALLKIGSKSVDPLVKLITNEKVSEQLRIAGLHTLAKFGSKAKEEVNDLPKKLAHLLERPYHSDMIIATCYALGEMGSEAHSATGILLHLCQNYHNSLKRLEAARTLGKIGPLSSQEIDLLIAALMKEQETLNLVSQQISDSERYPLFHHDKVPSEHEITKDEHRCVRVQIEMVKTLEKLQSLMSWKDARAVVMPALLEVLKFPHTRRLEDRWHPGNQGCYCPQCHLYIAAARALRYYGQEAKDDLPALEEICEKYEHPRQEVQKTIDLIQQNTCYLNPWLLTAVEGQAKSKLVVKQEKMVSDDGKHIIVVLRIRKNTLSRDELSRIFPNATGGWVKMGDEVKWARSEDQPAATRAAKIPAEKIDDAWIVHLTIPKIDHSTIHVWDTKYGDYSGHLHEIPLIWKSSN